MSDQQIVFDNIEQVKTFNYCLMNFKNQLSDTQIIELQKVVVLLCRNFDHALKDQTLLQPYDLTMRNYVYALVCFMEE